MVAHAAQVPALPMLRPETREGGVSRGATPRLRHTNATPIASGRHTRAGTARSDSTWRTDRSPVPPGTARSTTQSPRFHVPEFQLSTRSTATAQPRGFFRINTNRTPGTPLASARGSPSVNTNTGTARASLSPAAAAEASHSQSLGALPPMRVLNPRGSVSGSTVAPTPRAPMTSRSKAARAAAMRRIRDDVFIAADDVPTTAQVSQLLDLFDQINPPPDDATDAVTGTSRREQALLHRLFSLRLSDNCFVKRRLLALGYEAVVEELGNVCTRYSMRLLSLEDFHLVLQAMLPPHGGECVTPAESRLLFNLFDDNRSGIVDPDEFAQGLQLLLQNEKVVLVAHCRSLIEQPAVAPDAMVSALEIDLMLQAASDYYGSPAWFDQAAASCKEKMWRTSHKGQVSVVMFQHEVGKAPRLKEALLNLPEDGQYHEAARAPSPDPDAIVAQLGGRGRIRTDADEAQEAADDTATRGINYAQLDIRSSRFRGDEFMDPDDGRQIAAKENGNPTWYSSRGQIWRVVDGKAPEPVEPDY